ncbi:MULTISPECIES: hypothetical protein [Bacillaceae]|nr:MULTISPECIES: hypothetical protein [Bacillaceae]
MKKLLCIFHTMRLRYLLQHVESSKEVNQKILLLHLKLNELEKLKI